MRNLGLIVAFWLSALLPLNSLALGLGEIEVHSFLNQPLNAEIEVISARPGEVDDLLVTLASREAFAQAGLARPLHLTELRFKVKKSEDGDEAVIVVSSRGSIKEPFLNFLVEADWSKGRLLREFTVLLDPPFFADQPAAAEPASEPQAPSETLAPSEDPVVSEVSEEPDIIATVSEEPATSSGSVPETIAIEQDNSGAQSSSPPASSEYITDESENIIEGDVLIVKDDTLWSIASRFKSDSHSMSQVMLAFQRANPDAFGDGNINNLKIGSVLRAPSRDELDAIDEQAAYAEVLQQNGLWDEYVARVSGGFVMSGDSGESTGGDDSMAEDSGELSLLLPGDGDSESTGTGDSADVEQLRTKLALAEEELEAARIENKDMESRIAELQARLSKIEELQKMVEIEDDSLAQLQADQAIDDAQADDSASTESEDGVEETISETIQADEEALLEELLAEEAAAQAEEQAAQQQDDVVADAGDDTAMDDGMVSDDSMTDEDVMDDSQPVEQAESEQMTEDEMQAGSETPPPAPVIVTEPATRSSSIFDGILPQSIIDMIAPVAGLLGDPIILAAIGGVIVLLLVLVVVKRRKAASGDGDKASDDDDLFASDDDEFTPIHMTEIDEMPDTDIKVPSETDMDLSETETGTIEQVTDQSSGELAETAILQATDMPEADSGAPAAAGGEQDDVLNEVDVYLAYGLYDNAEDLLVTSLNESPGRADYRSKLLDTYFATKNADAFVGEAEKLKGMGDAASSYWDRVQIMGYELAPDNSLFSDAKDSGLSAADLEIAKPQEADFDLGSEDEDVTSFSSTDFNLGEEDSDTDIPLGEAGDLASTQQFNADEELPSLDADEPAVDSGDDLLELPDDIAGELEFSMDDDDASAEESSADDLDMDSAAAADEFELALDLDSEEDLEAAADGEETELEQMLAADGEETELEQMLAVDGEETELEQVAKADADDSIDLDFGDDDLNLDDGEEAAPSAEADDGYDETAIITPNYEETAVIQSNEGAAASGGPEDPSEIDLGMEDTAKVSALDDGDDDDFDLGIEDEALSFDEDAAEATGELMLDEADDSEDISIIDFGGDDFDEPTAVLDMVGDTDDGEFVIEDDGDDEQDRTGTFAPGDFDAPTEAISSIADVDEIDDLMLPDDVDEVSTKLDLARAFIDMGDTEGARGSLEEVMAEGNADQKAEAKSLLDQI